MLRRGRGGCNTRRMAKLAIEGTCLCEKVKVGAKRKPTQVTECNCSVCRRYGTLWAYYTRSAVVVDAPRGGLVAYRRRPEGRLRFVHCKTCGCVIRWETARDRPDERVGMNARLFDQALMSRVPIKVLDGDKTWKSLERYTKPGIWITPK
jgi:hypothetical protein